MGNGSKSGACKSSSHQLFKDKAKNRVDDLEGVFSSLQSARKESRSVDVAVLEEQVHQMLREWKSELNEPSPASSLQQGSLGFSSDLSRLLQLCEDDDDVTSALAAPKADSDAQKTINGYAYQENCNVPMGPQEQHFQPVEQCNNAFVGINMEMNNMNVASQPDYDQSFAFHHNLEQPYEIGFDYAGFGCEDIKPQISGYQPTISPLPSAFLGPKCALWDCPRPALGLDWCQKSDDYCSVFHAGLAPKEGYPGRRPVVRPGGIGLKDNLLFAALVGKSQGKEVGIPACPGAATSKSPWNAPELFDITVLDGETIREWLFFDKPRRAFESGNRKQRSLPDHKGRGWHESWKQVVKEFGGLKRSYYMDPQPIEPEKFEWHLYEYEINTYDACALYRLEIKRVDGKKSPKGKLANDTVVDLQKQMGRLTAEFPNDEQPVVKGRGKANLKKGKGRVETASNAFEASLDEGLDYLVDDINQYCLK